MLNCLGSSRLSLVVRVARFHYSAGVGASIPHECRGNPQGYVTEMPMGSNQEGHKFALKGGEVSLSCFESGQDLRRQLAHTTSS